jgi:hypothetical protein
VSAASSTKAELSTKRSNSGSTSTRSTSARPRRAAYMALHVRGCAGIAVR